MPGVRDEQSLSLDTLCAQVEESKEFQRFTTFLEMERMMGLPLCVGYWCCRVRDMERRRDEF